MENIPQNINIPPVQPKRHHRDRNQAGWALIFILAGVILLVQNLNLATFEFNWWALFLFIPVIGSLSAAWEGVRRGERFSTRISGALGSAAVIGTVGVILLFGMDWSRWWPLVVMAAGFSMFMTGLGKLERLGSEKFSPWVRLSAWVGLGGMVLGLGFLVKYLPIANLLPYITGYSWWAIPILIAGFGALINGAVIFFENQHEMNWAAWSMLLIAVFIIGIGVLVLFSLDLNILFPIVLIACGLVILMGLITKK